MASDSPDRGPRERDGTHRKHRQKKKSRERSSKATPTTSEGAGSTSASGSGSGQRLSMNALAQLNDFNTRNPAVEPDREPERRPRKEKSKPRREEYQVVDAEYESPRAERRRRDEYRDESGQDTPRRERRRRDRDGDDERYFDSPRDDRRRNKDSREDRQDDPRRSERRRRDEDREADTDYERPRRESRRPRDTEREAETDYETSKRQSRRKRDEPREGETDRGSPRRERRRRKDEYREVETDDEAPRNERARWRDMYRDIGKDSKESDKGRRSRKSELATESNDTKISAKSRKSKSRVVSGAIVEEGRASPGMRGGAGSKTSSYDSIGNEKDSLYYAREKKPVWWKRKRTWIIGACALIVSIVIIAVAVVVSKKNSGTGDSASTITVPESSLPPAAQGTYLDPYTWYTTTDFNTTYTNDTVGDLPIMGLMTSWDDSKAPNSNVPALSSSWGSYNSTPARGVNLGGWLSLEPFITPSLFTYDSKLGVIDEWTLCTYLGKTKCSSVLEAHYATFITEQSFQEIAAAGLDHVRIPYSYWAVQTYDNDPYLFRTSWRYLLRGIEYARKYGLRVNLDLHGLPGSQNGWNHSGRQGVVGWLNGTNGALNANRSLEIHDRLSKFFAQDRYKNIVAFYGLANEPRMVNLPADSVVAWTTQAFNLVRKNGITANVVFGDGFMGLDNWQGKLQGLSGLVLDVHQYVIFNNDQIVYTHKQKVDYACQGWTEQTTRSMNTATGFGPTMFAEWSQADTDCAQYLTNVGWGNRWTGTYVSGNTSTQALTPRCPALNSTCSCTQANSDPSTYSSSYKQFLKMFAEAQMVSFEKGWGWWYWTWDTEGSTLWSYKKGMAAGILPSVAYQKDFNCDTTVPDFSTQGLAETY